MKNLFLFTGEETFLLHEQMKAWKQAFIEKHGDINLDVLDASETPLNEVMAAVSAIPFLGDKRLIFIHGLPDAPPRRASEEASKKDEKRDEELKKLATDLKDIPDSSVVVFVQPSPDKRRSFYKKLISMAERKEFEPLQGATLSKWIQDEIKRAGATITAEAAEYLVTLTGHDLWRLSSEINKLTCHSPGEAISKALIDTLVVPTLEANIFQLTDALAIKDHKKAIHHLHRSVAADENLRAVFYMIVRQFRLLLQGSGFMENQPNGSATGFAATLKLHPFVARNTLGQLKNFSREELKLAYQRLLEIDVALKTSRIRVTTDNQDELALAIERFILNFCS